MRRSFPLLLTAIGILLAACASSKPAPVRDATQPEREYRQVRSESGEIREANIKRLYPNDKLFVCRGMTVTNRPRTDSRDQVIGYSRLVVVDGKVPIVTAPANNACVSSGMGQRWGKLHAGIDITSRPASLVFTGGAGTVIESGVNGGYGLAVLIDHGEGVYTRYAHLEFIEPDIKVGTIVHYGKQIGRMGQSGHVTGIHLHYEILTGKYKPGVRGRGLTARDPFSFPAWVDPRLQ